MVDYKDKFYHIYGADEVATRYNQCFAAVFSGDGTFCIGHRNLIDTCVECSTFPRPEWVTVDMVKVWHHPTWDEACVLFKHPIFTGEDDGGE